MTVAEATFTITYEGPALAEGVMPVRDLAPALLALSSIFGEASATVYPDREPVALNIRATEEGSFLVHLIVEGKHLWDDLVDVFGTGGASALSNLVQIVTASGIGVFWLIRRLHGRTVEREEPAPPGMVRITLDDGTTLLIPVDTWKLYLSHTVRQNAETVVEPLKRPGIEKVEFQTPTAPEPVAITKDDVAAYEAPDATEELGEQTFEMVVEIASVSFVEGNKWRFAAGDFRFSATVEDAGFLDGVNRHVEQFAKNDLLRCRVRQTQYRSAGKGLQTEWAIVEVLEHIHSGVQLSFDAEQEDEE